MMYDVRMKTIKCKSGIRGWQGRLQEVYSSYEEFCMYSDTYGVACRLGNCNTEELWTLNPIIQGSIRPEDLSFVSP